MISYIPKNWDVYEKINRVKCPKCRFLKIRSNDDETWMRLLFICYDFSVPDIDMILTNSFILQLTEKCNLPGEVQKVKNHFKKNEKR